MTPSTRWRASSSRSKRSPPSSFVRRRSAARAISLPVPTRLCATASAAIEHNEFLLLANSFMSFQSSVSMSRLAAIAVAFSPVLHAADEVVETVVVTAQKREESLQSVPISISAVSAAHIQRDLDSAPGDIARVVPNLYGNPTGGRGARPRWFLRGVGVNTSSLVSPIGVYFDEVYQSSLELHSF